MFAESGTVIVTERQRAKRYHPTVLKSGAVQPTGNEKAGVSAPRQRVHASVPKPFLDPIPARTDTFKKGRCGPPTKVLGDLTYADATPWLGAGLPCVLCW
ncbi:MAG: hypothetical protein IPO19_22480 [Rhodoferax sp.]|nr:hypothetical protein [Rhodoferax sp.]